MHQIVPRHDVKPKRAQTPAARAPRTAMGLSCCEAGVARRHALLPVPLDRVGGSLGRLVRIVPGAAQRPALTQQVPEAIELYPDFLQSRRILVKRRVVATLAPAQALALGLELLDHSLDLLVRRHGYSVAHIHGDGNGMQT